MTRNRPNDWVYMDQDERDAWTEEQDRIEDAEYEARIAREEAEEERQRANVAMYRAESALDRAYNENAQLEECIANLQRQNRELRAALQTLSDLLNGYVPNGIEKLLGKEE